MTPFLLRYLVSWLAFCLLAVVLFVKDVRVAWRAHANALLVPWRLALFVPALVFVTFAGRYTDDETWDSICGGGMALLTFLTAGFSIGTLGRALRGRASFSEVVVAPSRCSRVRGSTTATCCSETARTRIGGSATFVCRLSSTRARGSC